MSLILQKNWRWVQQILSSPIAKATPLIPLAGYSVIFSDYFRELWSFNDILPSTTSVFADWRPKCFYFGLVFLGAAQLLFIWRAHRIARSFTDASDFLTKLGGFLHRSGRTMNDGRYQSQLNMMLMAADLPTAGMSDHQRANDSVQLAEGCDRLFEYYDHRDPISATLCWWMIIIGIGLLSIPATDLFIRVVVATLP